MLAEWVTEELKTADLDDKRLNRRFAEVLENLAERPTASIPAATGARAETVGAYRLFANPKATIETVLQPHIDATRSRIAAQPVVLMAQDTTEIDVTRPRQQVIGAGPLDGNARFGALLHLMHVFTPDGTPLGTVRATGWTRGDEPVNAGLTRAQRAAIPIEDKESYRWVETLRQGHEEARLCPATQFISLADSEADVYEVLAEAQAGPKNSHWIIRACQERALLDENGQPLGTSLREYVLQQPVLFEQEITVRGREAKVSCEKRGRRQPRESRKTRVAVRAMQVTLRPPYRPDRKLEAVTLNVVLVTEVNPPEGDVPVEWVLLTDLPIGDMEQILLVIRYYTVRWMIEVFNRVLKSGCRIEKRLFEHMDRLLTALGVYLIVAWRTLYTCRLGRSCPDISCEALFEPSEWKSVWKVVRREDPPSEPPPLGVFIRMVAQLGGFVNRKRSDHPGPQTVWIGLQRMHDFATCWDLFGPGAQTAAPACPTEHLDPDDYDNDAEPAP